MGIEEHIRQALQGTGNLIPMEPERGDLRFILKAGAGHCTVKGLFLVTRLLNRAVGDRPVEILEFETRGDGNYLIELRTY